MAEANKKKEKPAVARKARATAVKKAPVAKATFKMTNNQRQKLKLFVSDYDVWEKIAAVWHGF